jgi:GH15 family glucan-1,4-alpha-glucosidase
VDIIHAGQGTSGAFVASPSFPQYGYAWLRDGSYCAMAMQSVGEWDSVWRFHRWVASALRAQSHRIASTVDSLRSGRTVPASEMLPTRYHLDGAAEKNGGEWPNFQLDGYGTWLFALHAACDASLAPPDGVQGRGKIVMPAQIAGLAHEVAEYAASAWRLPCYDYWEESPGCVHTSTLAALGAGLRAAAKMFDEEQFDMEADAISSYIGEYCVHEGAFVKGSADTRVDGSLLSLAAPFGLVSLEDERFVNTVRRIRTELSSPSGGIRRYVGDEYYGGSPWVLLTAWLGWYSRLVGDDEGYKRARDWVRHQAGVDGSLPEQVVSEPQLKHMVPIWEHRWGPVADPLLWSHAKYLLMEFG